MVGCVVDWLVVGCLFACFLACLFDCLLARLVGCCLAVCLLTYGIVNLDACVCTSVCVCILM